ncbi:phosphodiesterase, MJ0936 family [Denitrovibrio acetiphilus DSM 12809]|uniref:Phosphoesterase n=1 Tax=Denitrovibrio acetiphilus (strain DSM 12809 / NBRC 114555 / N2460) TaxID=522772 RepID=D4H3S9_DENA2|nr:metallophosphoesterase family protein [Denitrovibrio acetiphilus]ADD69181.1 phosphodiesterase, MJ0936 family [Denitrovibrio acetiphilus DSM 12809]
MNLLIISDTHTDSITKLPPAVIDAAKKADGIIHAGDVVSYKVISGLIDINPNVYAVKGNMDPASGENVLPLKRVLEAEGVRIGIAHGEGSPQGIENRLLYTFADDKVDIIIFGHTHVPFWGVIGEVHFLNPGSPTNKRTEPQHSYAILKLDDGKFDAEIVRF